jgi:tetratricopeptide (TPR) repeat protein
MTRVIRIAGPLIFSLLWACWSVGAALAQVQPDLGAQVEIPAIETEKPEAILSLAAAQMDRGDAAVALATIAQGLAQYPDAPRLLERQADIYATQPFLWPLAADLYPRLLARRPGDLTLKNKLANIFLALRRIDQAEKLFQEVLDAEPENAEAHVGLGRIYLQSAFFTLAQQHFDQALARMPDNQEAQKGLRQAQGLTTPQLQALAGYFEDAEGFRRTFLYSSYRLYLHPRLRLYGGYGYLTYNSGAVIFPKSNRGKTLHRHVLPLVLQYRPSRTLFLEAGGAFSDYGRWGQSGAVRTSAYWQATPGTGLSLSYSYHDVIDFFGPFRGPWGLYFDDFSSYGRYRYAVVNPIGLWSQSFFGASATNTLAVTRQIHSQEGSFWGYQALGERLIVSGMGILSSYTDNNARQILGGGVQFRVLMNPLFKIKYFYAHGDYKHRAEDLAPPGSSPAYADFQSLNFHSWGMVLEKNWGGRAKLALESNFNYSQQGGNPAVKSVNVLAEMNYLLTYHLSLRAVGFYSHSMGPGTTSYQMRSVSGGLSYRF